MNYQIAFSVEQKYCLIKTGYPKKLQLCGHGNITVIFFCIRLKLSSMAKDECRFDIIKSNISIFLSSRLKDHL